MKTNRDRIVAMTVTGVLAAMAIALLMIPEIVLFPGAAHLRMEFSNVPALAASVLFGLPYGLAVGLIKSVVQMFVTSQPTMGIGEFINFSLCAVLVLTFRWIWPSPSKGPGRYYLACAVCVGFTVLAGMLLNAALLPLYFRLIRTPLTAALYKTMILSSVPLNLIKPALCTLPMYPVFRLLCELLKECRI